MTLYDFCKESNKIEGINDVSSADIFAHEKLLVKLYLTVQDLQNFVSEVQPGAVLRDQPGGSVRVGSHIAPMGGPDIRAKLQDILAAAYAPRPDPWKIHCDYETLHPFTDGNGRSGRALWLWTMSRIGGEHWLRASHLGFLHTFYYQTLEHADGR